GDERFAERIERGGPRSRQRPQWHALRACRARREQKAVDREGEYADRRAFHEGASLDVVHGLLPRANRRSIPRASNGRAIRRTRRRPFFMRAKIQLLIWN